MRAAAGVRRTVVKRPGGRGVARAEAGMGFKAALSEREVRPKTIAPLVGNIQVVDLVPCERLDASQHPPGLTRQWIAGYRRVTRAATFTGCRCRRRCSAV